MFERSTFPPLSRQRCAFSLIEILSAVAIIGTLAVLLFPSLHRVYLGSQSATALNNLRQLSTVAAAYAHDNNEQYFGNNANYPNYWLKEFWPYAYPDRPFPFPNFSSTDSGALFRGTIFYTPFIEKAPINGAQPRSFGYNYPVETAQKPNLRYSLIISRPSAVALFGDTKTSGSWSPAQVNPRYNNSVHVVFLDQHAQLIPLANIPTSTTNTFWSGQ